MWRTIAGGLTSSALWGLAACCPDPPPRGDCAGAVARITGSGWTQGPEITWSVDGVEAATIACATLPTNDGAREDCETTFALDEVTPKSEVIRDAPDYVAFSYLNLNDWPEVPDGAKVRLAWPGGGVEEHDVALGDERAVESGNECPVRCRTGSLELEGVDGE